MPPKKLKDLSSAPVYTMAHEQQVRLLSDALLREYMHRRGFLATLKAFDEENPRDGDTISSRALMADLMALEQSDQQRLKGEGIETIMEMLCDLRVEKRQETEKLTAEASLDIPDAPSEKDIDALKEEIEMKRKKQAERKSQLSNKSSSKKHKKRKDKSEKKKGSSDGSKKRKKAADPHFDAPADTAALTLDDFLGSSNSSDSGSDHEGVAGRDGASDAKPAKTPAAAMVSPSATAPIKAKVSALGANAAHDSSEDGDSAAEEEEAVEGGGGVEGGSPLDAATAEAACRVIFGRAAHLPPLSFLQQGFSFDDSGLSYALVQWRRGPGAVVAAVQSLLITYMFEKEVYVNVKTRQLDCLRKALSTILFRAQPNPSSVVLVNGSLNARHPQKGFMDRLLPSSSSPSLFHAWTGFSSAEEVEDTLSEFLPEEGDQWLTGKVCGLWCFLLSVCLSRGVDTIAKDMATGGAKCLVDESTGDARKELLHLMLTGRATPNPQPRGVSGQLSGLLDGDASSGVGDTDKDEDGLASGAIPSALVNPGFPSWVVHHRGHYSNLFMKKDTRKVFRQKKDLSGNASADLLYWDPLTEEDEFLLTVEVSSMGQRKRSTSTSFVNTAIQCVPDWHKATVDWNGEAPPK